MAKFFPDITPDFRKSEAEFTLYKALKGLSDEWCVLHSVYVHQHGYKRSAEADFLLISKKVILVIEVKGGQIYAEGGEWCFKDRNGNIGRKKESPYQQAESAWHALKKLACIREPAKTLLDKVTHGWGCYFPDCEIPFDQITTLAWPPEMICDASKLAMKSTLDNILSMADYVLKKDLELAVANGRRIPRGLSTDEFSALVDCFRISFNSVLSMASSIEVADAQLVRLTSEQGDALWGMEGVRRLLVHGPAGTGKTLIAQSRFNSLISFEGGKRTALVCFNVLLADYLSMLNALKVVSGKSFVGTVHALLREYSKSLRDNPADHDGCLKDLEAWATKYPDGLFDAIIVDEGQDLRAQPKLCAALGCLIKGGWGNGEWVWFEDRAQSIVSFGADSFVPLHETSYRLRRNVRNGSHIAEFANKLTSNPAIPSDVPGHQVKSLMYRATDEVGRFNELEFAVGELLKKGFKSEHIVILDFSGNNEYLSKVGSVAGCNISGWTIVPRKGVLRYSTVRRFKGMESPAVVVYNVTGSIEKDDPLFYVASTRPKLNLTILATEEALMSVSRMISA